MSVQLVKGGNLNLSTQAHGLSAVNVGLGWDARVAKGVSFDLDASVFLLNDRGKVSTDKDFVFYNNLTSLDGTVAHQGDNVTGAGDGDDETVSINLAKISSEVKKIVIVVSINDADSKK